MTQPEPEAIPVVGVGAPAADLEAIHAFFATFQEQTGAAFVVVQQGEVDQTGLLAERLTGQTVFDVRAVKQDISFEPNTVYVVAPGQFVRTEPTRLLVRDPDQQAPHPAPIDRFFGSLAQSHGAMCFGVLLSGTGRDGALGIEDIKTAGGLILMQTPEDAEPGDGPKPMAPDLADTSGDVERLADRLALLVAGFSAPGDRVDEFRDGILETLAERTGYDFRIYKPGTLSRRLRRRMALTRIENVEDYARIIESDASERDALINDLLIGVTKFFRDPQSWESFGDLAVDPAIDRMGPGDVLRVWVVGCATGEEAYTLGILLAERIAKSGKPVETQIFATDLSASAIAKARTGLFPEASVADMSPERIERWFHKVGAQFKVVADLRERIVFAAQNATKDPPFSSVDMITCRNLMIYLDRDAQDRMVDMFHFALREGGHLMLGLAENIDGAKSKFETLSKRHRLYRRRPGVAGVPPPSGRPRAEPRKPALGGRPDTMVANAGVQAMLSRFVPPAVLVSDSFDIVSLHGEVDTVMEFARGTMSSNFLSMVAEPYRPAVWSALESARRDNAVAETRYRPSDPSLPVIKILAEPVSSADRSFYLVYFITEPPAGAPSAWNSAREAEQAGLETRDAYRDEIMSLQQQLRHVSEKGETSDEELQTANEEIMSANEELQSSNEELETSREELQSLNRELVEINDALETKIDELRAVNDDLSNLINSNDIPTLFLDLDLCIRRYSALTVDILRIRESDIGRPLADLASRLVDDDLFGDLRKVLEMHVSIETEVSGDDVGTYLRRIAPYRSLSGVVQGVILTYVDVTHLRKVASRLERQADRQASIVDLGQRALESEDVLALFDHACREVQTLLAADHVAIHERKQSGSAFNLIAGEGWPRGIVGATSVPASAGGELTFSVAHQGPIEIHDLNSEARFPLSQLLVDVGARSGTTLSIGPAGDPWGVFSVWWQNPGFLSADDENYLSSVGNVLWLAVNQAEAKTLRVNEQSALQELIDGLPIMVAIVDSDMRLELFNTTWQDIGLTYEETQGASLGDLLTPEMEDLCRRILANEIEQSAEGVEFKISVPGKGRRVHLVYCVPRRKNKAENGFFFAAIDINERKLWEDRNRVISAELDHRVKNILAIVNTISRMTGHNARSYGEFKDVFSQRISSLARTHSRLAARNWDGMDLRILIAEELQAFATSDKEQFILDGPDISVGMQPTQSLALAIHEMTTNAAKYGALSTRKGKVAVRWSVEGPALRLTWTESGVGPLDAPETVGFGSTLVNSAIAQQLEGDVVTSYGSDGIIIALSIPLANLQESPVDE